MKSDSEIKALLVLIVLILLFGAGAVLNILSVVFIVIIIIMGAGLFIWFISSIFQDTADSQRQWHIQKQNDEEERIKYEIKNPGRTRKKWLGLYIESEKSGNQSSSLAQMFVYSIIILVGLVGLFTVAIIVIGIIKMFSSA